MTKSGHDHLKRQARQTARATGRRYPDVLAELRRERQHAPATRIPRTPSTELVLRCRGFAHPLDGGRCAQPAGHPGHWTWCGDDPHFAVHIWLGYAEARDAAEHAKHETWLASLTPQQRAEYDTENEAAYYQEMADNAREPYDPDEERSIEYALDAADEERWAAEAEADGWDGERW
ncbi:hypothetical protein AB0J01_27770 [Streptomyces sp. NPDC050204]|uniref:hypothetical protein n=1 Tax=Streptomyces sp. NPDC050204 TaxID=3155514 RepID=UPI0034446874